MQLHTTATKSVETISSIDFTFPLIENMQLLLAQLTPTFILIKTLSCIPIYLYHTALIHVYSTSHLNITKTEFSIKKCYKKDRFAKEEYLCYLFLIRFYRRF